MFVRPERYHCFVYLALDPRRCAIPMQLQRRTTLINRDRNLYVIEVFINANKKNVKTKVKQYSRRV